MKRLLLALLLLLPGSALAQTQDTCTVSGIMVWTSATSITGPGTLNCTGGDSTLGADDIIDIQSGADLGCNGQVTQSTAANTGVTGDGEITILESCRLLLGPEGMYGDSLTVDLSGTVYDKVSEGFETLDASKLWPLPEDEYQLQVGDIYHCPGTAGAEDGTAVESDCDGNAAGETGVTNEIGICYPNARYQATQSNFASFDWDNLIDDVETEVETNGRSAVIWFHHFGGEAIPRDVNSAYSIVDVYNGATSNCLIIDLRQGCANGSDCPHEPDGSVSPSSSQAPDYSLAERGIGEFTTTAAYSAGERNLTVTSGAFPGAHERLARWATFADGFGFFPGFSVQVRSLVDGGGGNDTFETFKPGLPEAVASSETGFIDYGWRRGDTFSIMLPGVIGSATSGSTATREDSPMEISSLVGSIGIVEALGDAGAGEVVEIADSVSASWVWFRDLGADGVGGQFGWDGDVPSGTLYSWQVTGSSVDGNAMHGFGLKAGVSTLVGTGWNLRHGGDDVLLGSVGAGGPSNGFTGTATLNELRASFLGGGGGSCGLLDVFGGAGDWEINDFICEDCGCDDDSAASAIFTHSQNDGGGTVTVRRGAVLATRSAVGLTINAGSTQQDTEFYDVVIDGLVMASAVSGQTQNAAGPVMERFIVRAECDGGNRCAIGPTHSGSPAAFAKLVWKKGLIEDFSAGASTRAMVHLSETQSVMEDVAFIDVVASSSQGLVRCTAAGSVTNDLVLRRVHVDWPSNPSHALTNPFYLQFSGCENTGGDVSAVTLDGVSGARHDPTGSTSGVISVDVGSDIEDTYDWGGGPCFWENDDDMFGTLEASLDPNVVPQMVRDVPPSYVNAERGDWRIRPGSTWYNAGCGPRALGPANLRWAGRALGIRDPAVSSSAVGGAGGGGGGGGGRCPAPTTGQVCVY